MNFQRMLYRGRVTRRMFEQAPGGPSLTITLDEIYMGQYGEVTTGSAKAAREAIARGVEMLSRVYVVFDPNKDGKPEALTVELDTANRTQYPGQVTAWTFNIRDSCCSIKVSLDEPYHGQTDFVPSSAVSDAAIKRGISKNSLVYIIFNPNEAYRMEVHAVERRDQ